MSDDVGRNNRIFGVFHDTFQVPLRGGSENIVHRIARSAFLQIDNQVGNRAGGERLSHLVSDAQCRLAAAAVLLSPFVPLIFMGEEYGEEAPFLYFTSHSDADLVEAVRKGRTREFAGFEWVEVADPQAETTFLQSRLRRSDELEEEHSHRLAYYRALTTWRRYLRTAGGIVEVKTNDSEGWLSLHHQGGKAEFFVCLHFCPEQGAIQLPSGRWCMRLDSSEETWPDPGVHSFPPVSGEQPVKGWSCVVYERWEG